MDRHVMLMGDLSMAGFADDLVAAASGQVWRDEAFSLGQRAGASVFGGGGSSDSSDSSYWDDQAQAAAQASGDLAKRAAETQQAAIIHGAESAAHGIARTGNAVVNKSIGKVVLLAALGGGVYLLGKHQGWF